MFAALQGWIMQNAFFVGIYFWLASTSWNNIANIALYLTNLNSSWQYWNIWSSSSDEYEKFQIAITRQSTDLAQTLISVSL
jgi:hypothetical protein